MKKITCFFLALAALVRLQAQESHDCLVAAYSFDNHNVQDDVGSCNGTAVGATLVTDRFGNPYSAWYLYGNPQSYLNLGTYTTLKPKIGSISLWFRMDNIVYSGSGFAYNPLLHTKCQQGNNCYEAYCIYYSYLSNNLLSACTQLYCNQPAVHTGTVSLQTWHHVVYTYDYNWEQIYFDGVKQDSIAKNFTTTFLLSDSVMVGTSANGQNNRQFNGAVDDIRFYKCVISAQEVAELYGGGVPTAIDEATGQGGAKIYYSAEDNKVHVIDTTGDPYRVEITDLLGRTLLLKTDNQGPASFDAPQAAGEILLVRLSNKKSATVKKIFTGK